METPMPHDAYVSPAELRRHVLAALAERAQLGDQLAVGAIKVCGGY